LLCLGATSVEEVQMGQGVIAPTSVHPTRRKPRGRHLTRPEPADTARFCPPVSARLEQERRLNDTCRRILMFIRRAALEARNPQSGWRKGGRYCSADGKAIALYCDELIDATDCHKSTVLRAVARLCDTGYLHRIIDRQRPYRSARRFTSSSRPRCPDTAPPPRNGVHDRVAKRPLNP
jgi:hypothetical protein